MRLADLTTAGVLGRWIYYRRVRGYHAAALQRAYIQEAHPGDVVGMVTELHDSARAVYPLRPKHCTHPLLLPIDELEIHAIVEPTPTPEPAADAPTA